MFLFVIAYIPYVYSLMIMSDVPFDRVTCNGGGDVHHFFKG